MTMESRAYVLITCLFVLAILSVAALATMRSASLMAQHNRALEVAVRNMQLAHDALQLSEASLLNGEPQIKGSALGCETSIALRVSISRMHELSLDAGDDAQAAKWVVYGLQTCQDGHAVMEVTLGVIEPLGAFEESAMPKGLEVGRLSWRRTW